jgi:choline dehydrogenase
MLFNPMGFLQSGWKFALSGAGPATFVHSMIAFAKLDPSSGDKYPDLQFHFAVNAWEETADGVRLLDKPCVTLQVNPTRPQSRGYVRLRSPDPADAPIIQPNLLESESDFALLLAGLKMARSVFETEAFSPYVVAERTPGPGVRDDAALGDYIRNYTTVGFHPVGSVKMGTDPQSVVDPQLRVIGVAKLRVVDSSIIPQLPSANTNAISMVIGEKGADLLLEDRAL